ncbi:hypothetical protein D3C76_1128150 [compost metagenome]
MLEPGLQRIPTLSFAILIAPPVCRRLLTKLPTTQVEAAAQPQPTVIALLAAIFIVVNVQVVIAEQHAFPALPLRGRNIVLRRAFHCCLRNAQVQTQQTLIEIPPSAADARFRFKAGIRWHFCRRRNPLFIPEFHG